VATFNSHSFSERGDTGKNVPGWDKKFTTVELIVPGGSPVIHSIGVNARRLAMPIQGTNSQLDSLEGDIDGSTHSLVWSDGTDTCLLEAMDTRIEIKSGHDVYQTVLHFIK